MSKRWMAYWAGIVMVLVALSPLISGATITNFRITPSTTIDGKIVTYGIANITVDDPGDAERCELWIDGDLYAYMRPTGGGTWDWFYPLDTRGFADGAHTIQIRDIGGSTGDDVKSWQIWFDNSAPVVKNITVIYPYGYDSAKNGSQIVITAEVSDEIAGVANVSVNASALGAGIVYMYDDGAHGDKAAGDGIYGTGAFTVYAKTGYQYVNITAIDNVGNFQNYTCEVKMDNYPPTLWGMQAILPPGQKAVKLGDKIRIVGYARDLKMQYIKVTTHIPIDVVLVIDNSRSMAGQPWADLEKAATQFIQNLSDEDRIAIVSFYPQSGGEQDHLYLPFVTAGEPATCPICGANFSTGRELAIHVITADDGQHLTDSNGDPDAFTPIWDAIGNATLYAWNNHLPGHVPVVIAITDGDDWGENWGVASGREAGSETFCPGARWSEVGTGYANKTWNITGDLYWGSGLGVYTWHIARYTQNLGGGGLVWSDLDLTDKVHDNTRYGLYGAPLPIFTIGLGVQPQASNSSAPGYISPTENTSTTGGAPSYVDPNAYTYNFTTEYDLNITIAKSSGGQYFFAPNSSQLTSIYAQIGQIIQYVGVQWFGMTAPHGFKEVYADLSDLGITTPVVMYDDGEHGDGAAGDDLYGTDYVTVNTDATKLAAIWMHGIDLAGNTNKTFMLIKVDNTNPVIHNITVVYPQNQTWAQDGERIYIEVNATDVNSGIRKVVLDATSIGGSDNIVLYDNGKGNDLLANDGIYTSPNITVSTGLATGTYQVKITVYDYANNYISQYVNVVVNNSGTPPVSPEVNILSVANNDVLRGQVSISINASDEDGIPDTSDNPIFYVDNAQRIDMQRVSGNNYSGVYSGVLDTMQYADGEHTLTFEVEDSLGAVTKQTIDIVIDNTQPSANVINPASGEYISGTYAFRIYASDNIEVNNVTVYIDGNSLSAAFNSQSGYWEVILDTTTLTDGTHNIYAVVYDTAGNSYTTGTVNFYVDNTPPSLAVISPTDNEVISGVYNLQVESDDANSLNVYYKVDNGGWVAMSGGPPNWTASLDTTTYSDGSHTIYFKAEDGAGHTTETYVNVIIDNNPPEVKISNLVNEQFVTGAIDIEIYASDYVDVSSVKITIVGDDTGQVIVNNASVDQGGEGYWVYSIDTTALSDGNYTITVYATDAAGHTVSDSVSINVDNNAPELTLVYPIDGEIVEGTVDISYYAYDVYLDRVQYNVDGTGWISVSVPWNTNTVSDGWHILTIRAVDSAGHTTQTSVSILVDNNAPYGYVESPEESSYLEGTYTFRVYAYDSVGIDRVVLYVDGSGYDMLKVGDYYVVSIDTHTLGDGNHSVYAVIYDDSGKDYTTTTVNFYVDNNAPYLAILSPYDMEVLSGEVNIDVEVSDVFLSAVEYSVDNVGFVSIDTPLNTSMYEDGLHTITVRAMDKAGHITERSVTVYFDNTHPSIIDVSLPSGIVSGTLHVQVKVGDSVGMSEVYSVIKKGNESVARYYMAYNSATGYYEIYLDTSGFDDGIYTIEIHGVDVSGKESVATSTFTIDNSAPKISYGGSIIIHKSTVLEFSVSDSTTQVKEVWISIDGGEWIPMQLSGGKASYKWNIDIKDNGVHKIRIKAVDSAGNEQIWEKDFYVDVPNYAPFIYLVILVILLIVVILAMKRKKIPKFHEMPEEKFGEETKEEEMEEPSETLEELEETEPSEPEGGEEE